MEGRSPWEKALCGLPLPRMSPSLWKLLPLSVMMLSMSQRSPQPADPRGSIDGQGRWSLGPAGVGLGCHPALGVERNFRVRKPPPHPLRTLGLTYQPPSPSGLATCEAASQGAMQPAQQRAQNPGRGEERAWLGKHEWAFTRRFLFLFPVQSKRHRLILEAMSGYFPKVKIDICSWSDVDSHFRGPLGKQIRKYQFPGWESREM